MKLVGKLCIYAKYVWPISNAFVFKFSFVDLLRQYLTQVRQETGTRLLEKVFNTSDGKPNKWWTCFAKKRFMEHSLSGFGQ